MRRKEDERGCIFVEERGHPDINKSVSLRSREKKRVDTEEEIGRGTRIEGEGGVTTMKIIGEGILKGESSGNTKNIVGDDL